MKSETLDYFNHNCFQKLFAAVSKKYRSLGRVGGSVKLQRLSPEERAVLTGFLGRDCRGQVEIIIKLQEVNERLQQSRFALTLPEFLSLYFGVEIVSDKETAQQENRRWAAFFAKLEKEACTAVTRAWLAEISGGGGAGYRTVLTLYRQNKSAAATLLKTCVEALDQLVQFPGRRRRLPVFAAGLTGDPHALDGEKPLGRLLFFALHHLYELSETEYGAERRRELFSRAGLEEDDLSSNVIVAGLRVNTKDPRAPVFNAPDAAASPLVLPLRFLQTPTGWLSAKVYTLENPAVFSAILDSAPAGTNIPNLICTSGQPSIAALKLLDQLVAAGSVIYYGGDFDPHGLEIGQRLSERFGASFQPFFFDTVAYMQAPKGVGLTAEQRQKLAGQNIPWDNNLSQTILQTGRAVYQEVLVEQMIKRLFNY